MSMFKKSRDRMIKRIWIDPSAEITDDDLAKREDPSNGIITIQETGVEVRHPETVTSVQWSDLIEVLAYKRDLLATDLICLVLCASDGNVLEPHREMQGFVQLWRELETRFAGFKENFSQWILVSPAFDSEPTLIWKKET